MWKGQRFPISACISGWSMLHGQTVAIEDVFTDPRIPHDAYRRTFVKSLIMTPIMAPAPVAAIGAYWRERRRLFRTRDRRGQNFGRGGRRRADRLPRRLKFFTEMEAGDRQAQAVIETMRPAAGACLNPDETVRSLRPAPNLPSSPSDVPHGPCRDAPPDRSDRRHTAPCPRQDSPRCETPTPRPARRHLRHRSAASSLPRVAAAPARRTRLRHEDVGAIRGSRDTRARYRRRSRQAGRDSFGRRQNLFDQRAGAAKSIWPA